MHVVRTTHVQHLIRNGLALAKLADDQWPGSEVRPADGASQHRVVTVEDALEKAAADLRHAAAELDAERLSCRGWKQ